MIEADALETIARLKSKIILLNKEMDQYIKDLHMWEAAHASEYPSRRIKEVKIRIEDIEKI